MFHDFALSHYSQLAWFAAVNVLFLWGSSYFVSRESQKRIDELQAEVRRLAALISREEPETGIFVMQNSN
jgi:hypothetical protein